MTKLLDILLEVLRESKPIKLDKSVIPQMEKIYDKFKRISEDPQAKIYFEYEKDPIFLGRLSFNNPYDPNWKGVSVDLDVTDANINAAFNPRENTITFNFNSEDLRKNKSSFMNTFYHEIVHSIDPKIKNTQLRTKIYTKLKAKDKKDKTTKDYIKYLKDPAEFDAFSSSFANQIEDELELLSDEGKQKVKAALKSILNDLLGILNNNNTTITPKEEFDKFIKDHRYKLGSIAHLIFDDSSDVLLKFLANIILYKNKPSQFKKYIQRLATLL